MKALLARMLKFGHPERENADVLEEAGRLFDTILNDSITFCNASLPESEKSETAGGTNSGGNSGNEFIEERSKEMKQHLEQ